MRNPDGRNAAVMLGMALGECGNRKFVLVLEIRGTGLSVPRSEWFLPVSPFFEDEDERRDEDDPSRSQTVKIPVTK